MIVRRSIAAALILSGCVAAYQPPPDLVITSGDSVLTLEPAAYCWIGSSGEFTTTACASGAVPDPLPHLGVVDGHIEVEWPLASWSFEAAGANPDDLKHETIVGLVDSGDGVWVLEPDFGIGLFQIGLSGHGPEGSVSVAFLADLKA